MEIISVKGLTKHFKDIKAVEDVSFSVEKGELFGSLGVNGAGKSTTINMLCTLLQPTAGSAEICGCLLGKEDEELRRHIGVVYQNNCLDERLTVKENLRVRGALYEKDKKRLWERMTEVCELLELEEVYLRHFGKLSGGWKRRCEIGAALLHAPQLLFLDEPTTGLDPATRKMIWKCVKQLQKEKGTTVFLTTHYMEEAAGASHIAILDGGRLIQYGTPFSLKEAYAKDRMYLYCEEVNRTALQKRLEARNIPIKQKGERFVVNLSDSLAALPLLAETEGLLSGFEVVQGTLDDVFLEVTGKDLKEGV